MALPWLQILFLRELRSFAAELDLFPLEEQVWATLPGVTNPVGTLVLHVSGNLQHYVGAVLGSTGYVRNRSLEFSARGVSRAELKAELQRASAVVETVIPTLTESVLAQTYPEPLPAGPIPTGLFLLHLGAHLSHHLGQAGYLRRVLTGQNTSSGAVALRDLGISPPPAT